MRSSADRTGKGVVLRDSDRARTVIPFQITHSRPAETQTPTDARTLARSEGYATGWAQGMREARTATAAARGRAADELDRVLADRDERATSAVRALGHAVDAVRVTTVRRAEEIVEYLLAAAVDLAETLVGAELSADVLGGARSAVRRALAELPTDEPVTVRLNPADRAELVAAEEQAAEMLQGRSVTLISDPALARGDAVAVTGVRTVDARLSAAVDRVRAELAA